MALLHHVLFLAFTTLALVASQTTPDFTTVEFTATSLEVTELSSTIDPDATDSLSTIDPEATDSLSTIDDFTDESNTIEPGSASDIKVKSFDFTNTDLEFDLDVDNIYTISVEIRNVGGTDIASIADDGDSTNDGDDNWEITFYVSDVSNTASSNVITSMADSSSATNMAAGLDSGDSVTLTDVYALINVPTSECSIYEYICVSVTTGSTANYTDADSTNDDLCYSISETLAVYNLVCAGCLTQASYLLLLVTALVSCLLL